MHRDFRRHECGHKVVWADGPEQRKPVLREVSEQFAFVGDALVVGI